MALRDDAVAAYTASQNGAQGQARAALAGLLAPENISGLTLADMAATDTWTLFVFTDGDLRLAVRQLGDGDWSASLVTGSVGDWTEVGGFTTLAELGKLTPKVPKPATATPPAIPAWAPQLTVTAGQSYTYGGATYKVLQGHTTQVGWEPPNVPALWTRVS